MLLSLLGISDPSSIKSSYHCYSLLKFVMFYYNRLLDFLPVNFMIYINYQFIDINWSAFLWCQSIRFWRTASFPPYRFGKLPFCRFFLKIFLNALQKYSGLRFKFNLNQTNGNQWHMAKVSLSFESVDIIKLPLLSTFQISTFNPFLFSFLLIVSSTSSTRTLYH